MSRKITRRDFINSSLVGAGASLMSMNAPLMAAGVPTRPVPPNIPRGSEDWYGYGGVGDYAPSHGNTPQVLADAHGLRHDKYDFAKGHWEDTGEVYDLVVVGAGLAGLGAALEFKSAMPDSARCLLIDNHPLFGGEAKQNEFDVDGYRLIAPQGSNGFSIPEPPGDKESDYAIGDSHYYALLGMPREYQYPEPAAKDIRFGNDNFGFLYWLAHEIDISHYYPANGGVHVPNVWQNNFKGAPIPAATREALVAANNNRDTPYSGADLAKWADKMSARDFLEKVMKMSPEVTAYLDPIVASGVGTSCDATSAYVFLGLGLPGARGYNDHLVENRHSFPGGNSGFARHFVKRIMPHAISGEDNFEDIINGQIQFDKLDDPKQPVSMRLGATVVGVEHDSPNPADSESVRIYYVRDGKQYQMKAKSVVMAGGGWVNKHVVRDLPAPHFEAYNTFNHAAFLVANVALTNWKFLEKLGTSGSIYEGDFGFSCNLRRPMSVGPNPAPFTPDKPAVLTFYVPFYTPGQTPAMQGTMGRMELFGTSYAAYEAKIIAQLNELYGAYGFNAEQDIAGIVLNRWGHAYVMSEPGFFYGRNGNPAAASVVSQPHGRISFGHSELKGMQHWGPAANEGRRAFDQVKQFI